MISICKTLPLLFVFYLVRRRDPHAYARNDVFCFSFAVSIFANQNRCFVPCIGWIWQTALHGCRGCSKGLGVCSIKFPNPGMFLLQRKKPWLSSIIIHVSRWKRHMFRK